MLSFGQYLREMRLKKGISVDKVAHFLGIEPTVYSNFESGSVIPLKYQVFIMADYYNENAREFLIFYQRQRLLNEQVLHNGEMKSGLAKNEGVAFRRYRMMRKELHQLINKKLNIRIHKPAHPLSNYIESVIYYEGHTFNSISEIRFPDGKVHLFIELDGQERTLRMSNGNLVYDVISSWITGLQEQHMAYDLKPAQKILSVRFNHGGFYAVTGFPQEDLKNAVVDAESMFGSSIRRLRDELLEGKDLPEIFTKTENYFKVKIREKGIDGQVVRYLCHNMKVPLPELIRKSGYSHKHIITLFKKHVGVVPKYFQRIRRFNKALNDIHSKRNIIDWPGISYENQYYDQAHFIKEFNHFAGMNPESYLATGSTCSEYLYKAR